MNDWRSVLATFVVCGAVVGCGLSVKGTRRAPIEEPEVADTPVVVGDASPPAPPPPPPGDAGPIEDTNAPATIADYCSKCASCIASSTDFSDDFCDAHKSGDRFDLAACTAANDGSELGQRVSKRVLSGWSCGDFDEAQ